MADEDEQLEAKVKAAQRLIAVRKAQDSLVDFMRLTMPDPEDAENPEKSLYNVKAHHRLLCEALEKVERGEILRLAVAIAPQHGKSQIISRGFPAWSQGRKPWRNLMQGTYNQDFANDFGSEVREIMTSPMYKQVFPDLGFRRGNKAKDFMVTSVGGKMSFLGRGGAGTGKPADIFLIDDPLKDDKEAQSPTIRNEVWQWFTKVAYTRCHAASAIVIVHTRWHEDDLIGRLLDPDHPDHDPEIAKDWTYINIPAILKRGDDTRLANALGVTEDKWDNGEAALWPERFSLQHLRTARRLNPVGFSALYQGKPSPDDGDYFTKDMIHGYQPHQLPANLRKYAASDHALTEKQENDANVLGCGGVDENGVLWILPDLVWERMETDRTIEEILILMQRHKPELWWAENDHISKGFGPFLRRRQRDEGVFCKVDPITPSKDLKLRARSIQGMMALGMVRFPTFASWWPAAQRELLKFPNATHDDFVAFLAMFGLGLDKEHGATRPKDRRETLAKVGTLAWVKEITKRQEKRERIQAKGGF